MTTMPSDGEMLRDAARKMADMRAQLDALKAELEQVKEDRDLWKESETTCSDLYAELEAEHRVQSVQLNALRALVGELVEAFKHSRRYAGLIARARAALGEGSQ